MNYLVHFSIVGILTTLVSATSLSANLFGAESGKGTALRLAYSAITVNQAIPWIAHDAGHFKKHGLDVELVHASSILALAGAARRAKSRSHSRSPTPASAPI